MAYDAAKDKEVKTWKHEGGLYVSVYQYNGGEPKVQIGPRGYKKADGSDGFGKVGRLTLEEIEWLDNQMVEIKATMHQYKA
jgi:hypothetical protein